MKKFLGLNFLFLFLFLGEPTVQTLSGTEEQRSVFSGITASFACLTQSSVRRELVATTDPTRGNNDGFGGELTPYPFRHYPYKRRDKNNNIEYVLFKQVGKGRVVDFSKNFWSSLLSEEELRRNNIREDYKLKIYIDDETAPRFVKNVKDFFNGNDEDFPGPLSWHQSGGYNCVRPMEFCESMMITASSIDNNGEFTNDPPRFNRVGTLMYGDGIGFDEFPSIQEIERVHNNVGSWPHETSSNWHSPRTVNISANDYVDVAHYEVGGAILGLDFQVGSQSDWKDLWIEIYFDGHSNPDVNIPLGMLCGCSYPLYPVNGIFFKHDGDLQGQSYWPMPFSNQAKIRIRNKGSQISHLTFRGSHHLGEYPEPWGYFRAMYTEALPKEPGNDMEMAKATGHGKYVHHVHEFETPDPLNNRTELTYLEGDYSIRLDSKLDTMRGAAWEVENRWGWYFANDNVFSRPLHGNSGIVITPGIQELIRSQYTTYLTDYWPFNNRFEYTHEAGAHNELRVNVRAATFLYMQDNPRSVLVDILDVGSQESERNHFYDIGGGNPENVTITSRYLADDLLPEIADEGYIMLNSVTTFQIACPLQSTHMELKLRRLKNVDGDVGATLYVDNQLVERRLTNTANHANYKWGEMSFFIPGRLLRDNKGQVKPWLNIRVVPDRDVEWSEFRWEAWSHFAPHARVRTFGETSLEKGLPLVIGLLGEPVGGQSITLASTNSLPNAPGMMILGFKSKEEGMPYGFGEATSYIDLNDRETMQFPIQADENGRYETSTIVPPNWQGRKVYCQLMWVTDPLDVHQTQAIELDVE